MEKNKQSEQEMERWGTVHAWAKEFALSDIAIKNRIKGILGINGIDPRGRVLEGSFYSESTIRKACVDLLGVQFQSDAGGLLLYEGECYRTLNAWHKELGISDWAIKRRLKDIKGILGKSSIGQIYTFYAEHDVRTVCADLLNGIHQADSEGLFTINEERFGTRKAWGREMGISSPTVRKKLCGIDGIRGKVGGRIYLFYSESIVQNACGFHLSQADESGFFILNEERFGNIDAWRRILKINFRTIKNKLKNVNVIQGKDSRGKIRTFYPESSVRSACSDLLPSPRKNGKK